MSLTVFLAFCILGLDFMIYAFFQWIYGERRSALARQLVARKNARKEGSPRPFLVASQKADHGSHHPASGGVAKSKQIGPSPRGSYKERLA
jgi:hypothetical protein